MRAASQPAASLSYAVIEEHVDPRPGHERHKPFQQLHGCEDEMGRPVRPRPPEGHGDPPVAQPVQPALPERRPADALAEPFEPRAITRGDVRGRLEVEAGLVCVKRDVPLDPRRVRVGPDPDGTPARTPAEGGPAENRRAGEARERRRFVRERIRGPVGHRRPHHRSRYDGCRTHSTRRTSFGLGFGERLVPVMKSK
jgi:hypothetical protein